MKPPSHYIFSLRLIDSVVLKVVALQRQGRSTKDFRWVSGRVGLTVTVSHNTNLPRAFREMLLLSVL
ncbi:unnamed protein product [Sphenostylis stenocarpa]|uniref:Uncharacterized protein n=1 Tax=Sphenostylis stenocarpa TaxID=92480 RepID=A0AA86W3D8_9FABA|nr:unnamed protein product [Sphenostylis stenocarpa]